MAIKKIDGNLLRKAIINAAFVLRQNKKNVDALNVFPVPDGDTGTNMSLTMDQAVRELEKVSSNDLKKIADALAWGSLMGGRGNSGVILSQLFRGFAQGIPSNKKSITPYELATAYKNGVDAAYRAVMRPVEGTILTVARETADKMIMEARRYEDLETVLENTIKYGEKVLEKTPDMLKVLKEANVVDAGGKGLIFLMKGFLEAIKNPNLDVTSLKEKNYESSYKTAYESEKIPQEIKYIYCTELLITGKEIDINSLKQELDGIGDSMIVTGMGDLVKIHIHTNNPDRVLNAALKRGELSKIKIDNMKIQHNEIINNEVVEENKADIKISENKETTSKKKVGVIAVSQGKGLNEIFKSMGADIIEGGQSMNPSTEDILSAIENSSYEDAIILPNNKNIILTAQQAKSISTKNVYVVPTKSIPQGIAALLAFNPDFSVQENISNMERNIQNVISGEVTYAVRDTSWDGIKIKKGDIIGIKEDDIVVIGDNKEKVLLDLVDKMAEGAIGGIITIYYGDDVSEDSVKEAVEALTEKYKDFDVEYYFGGQSLYYYIVSLE